LKQQCPQWESTGTSPTFFAEDQAMWHERLASYCGPEHFKRRTLLQAAGLGSMYWLTHLSQLLAQEEERAPRGQPAKSVIVLWMAGGPSQLETFDPKPGSKIASGTKARSTRVPGVQIAEPYEQLADQMHHLSLVRSLVSKEGDHERASYAVKTGYRPDPTLVHPSLGAILCHKLTDKKVEIPRHVSILPGQWPARGGYLGAQYDAFKVSDPQGPIPDVAPSVSEARLQQRVKDLAILESEFARGRLTQLEGNKTLHSATTQSALKMMSSEQLKAFDIKLATEEWRAAFGDTPFGRGCLAAARLIEVGVRCVEVTLDGWDSHVNNREIHLERARTLDPAFAALLRYLHERQLLDSTVVLWGGEFGRTPKVNPFGGRDHWPHGFTMALAGGGLRAGQVIGETSSDPPNDSKDWTQFVTDPRPIADIHATVMQALGVSFDEELMTPIGRPMKLCEGKVIPELLT
jgi:hypothetical protein